MAHITLDELFDREFRQSLPHGHHEIIGLHTTKTNYDTIYSFLQNNNLLSLIDNWEYVLCTEDGDYYCFKDIDEHDNYTVFDFDCYYCTALMCKIYKYFDTYKRWRILQYFLADCHHYSDKEMIMHICRNLKLNDEETAEAISHIVPNRTKSAATA